MAYVWFSTTFLVIFYSGLATAQDGATNNPPGCFPAGGPSGTQIDIESLHGVWHLYANGPRLANTPFLMNMINVHRRLGYLRETIDYTAQYAQYWQNVFYQRVNGTLVCGNTYYQENVTCDGASTGTVWSNFGNGWASFDIDFRILFVESDFMMIRVECYQPRFTSGEPCQMHGVQVHIRKITNDLTEIERKLIKETVDNTLEPYCLSLDQLILSTWDDGLPACDWGERPAAFKERLANLHETNLHACRKQSP